MVCEIYEMMPHGKVIPPWCVQQLIWSLVTPANVSSREDNQACWCVNFAFLFHGKTCEAIFCCRNHSLTDCVGIQFFCPHPWILKRHEAGLKGWEGQKKTRFWFLARGKWPTKLSAKGLFEIWRFYPIPMEIWTVTTFFPQDHAKKRLATKKNQACMTVI